MNQQDANIIHFISAETARRHRPRDYFAEAHLDGERVLVTVKYRWKETPGTSARTEIKTVAVEVMNRLKKASLTAGGAALKMSRIGQVSENECTFTIAEARVAVRA